MAKAPQKAAKEISSSKGAAKGKSAAKKVKAREKGKSRTLPARRTREGSGKKNHALSHLVSYETAQEIMALLCRRYPDAECELAYESPFQLLIAVILSAQTTDAQVNKVTPRLFKRFPTAQALANGSLDEIKEIIRPTGYYNAKATSIQNAARGLVEKFAGQVPKTLEELTTLPGVGRKTANVVLGVAYDIPGWTVDTHVQRLAQRLGFTKNTDPNKIEQDLQRLFPNKDWSQYSITIIWHGRRICFARLPDCHSCPVNHLCSSSLVS